MNPCSADAAAASVRGASHRALSSLDIGIIGICLLNVFAIATFISRKNAFQKITSWPEAMVVFVHLRLPGEIDIPFWLGLHGREETSPFA